MRKIIFYFLFLSVFVVGCKGQAKKAVAADTAVKADTMVVDSMYKPITAIFTGTDKKSDVKYTVQVVFYPSNDKAVVTMGADTYDLIQYVTADGYGYKNDKADLRGKGNEATLTFSDKKRPVLYLTEQK